MLVGSTAPGLQDPQSTPVGADFPESKCLLTSSLGSWIQGSGSSRLCAGLRTGHFAGGRLGAGLRPLAARRAARGRVALLICAVLIGLNSWLYRRLGAAAGRFPCHGRAVLRAEHEWGLLHRAGDAVNLASRLKGLGVHYGVEIVASAATQRAAPGFVWQELDTVRVQGKARTVRIFMRVARIQDASAALRAELQRWDGVLSAYRRQDWLQGQAMLAPLVAADAKKVLYQLYAQRLASMSLQSEDP